MTTSASIIEDLWFEEDLADDANIAAAASFAAKLTQAQGLKTFPAVAQKILTIFSDDDFRIGEVTQALQEDPSLASSILRMANSAFFVPASPITQINQAFVRIGVSHVKEIVCAVATMEMFHDADGLGSYIRDHCAAVAGLSHCLGREFSGGNLEGVFLSGLLHDIGKLMLIESNEMDYPVQDWKAALKPNTMHEFERKRLGYDHAVLAAHIVSSWNFGPIVSKTIAWHHQPRRAFANKTIGPKVALVRMADSIDFILSCENDDYERDIRNLTDGVEADILGITEGALKELWAELYRIRNDSLSTFSPRK